jgi:hypothetical protein
MKLPIKQHQAQTDARDCTHGSRLGSSITAALSVGPTIRTDLAEILRQNNSVQVALWLNF